MTFLVTHYFPEPPQSDAWLPLHFITRENVENEDRYFIGFDRGQWLTSEIVELRVRNNEICPLETPITLRDDQALWLASDGELWIADESDPLSDRQKTFVEKIRVSAERLDQLGKQAEVSIVHRIQKRQIPDLDKKELLVLDKGYVSGQAYGTFVRVLAEVLANRNNALPSNLERDSVPWQYVQVYLKDGSLDICLDPYFKTRIRPLVDLVEFGSIKKFCCYARASSQIIDRVVETKNIASTKDRILQLLKVEPGLQIGLFEETAASTEVRMSMQTEARMSSVLSKTADTVEDLKCWIAEKPDSRIIFCDHGIAAELNKVTPGDVRRVLGRNAPRELQHEYRYGGDGCTFQFAASIPIGFAYPSGDERWRVEIVSSLVLALNKLSEGATKDPWDQTGGIAGDLKRLGMSPFKLAELCQYLHHPEFAECVAACSKQDYEKRKALKPAYDRMISAL